MEKGIYTCGYSIPSVVFAPAGLREKSCHIMVNLDVSASAGFLQTKCSNEHYVGMEAAQLDQEKFTSKCRKWVSVRTEASSNSPRCQSKDVKVNKSHTPRKINQRNSGKAGQQLEEEEEGSQGWVVDFSACPCCKSTWTVPSTTQLHFPNSRETWHPSIYPPKAAFPESTFFSL